MKSSVKRIVKAIIASVVLFAGATLHAHADQSITLRSGNGTIGTQDAQVRFLAYGAFGNITPTAADFTSVQSGTFAHVVTPYGTYVQKLPSDPLAQWIATTPGLGGGSALYAIPFTVTDTIIGSASLTLGYAVDNALNGVYINGTPISNNPLDGDYHGEYYVMRSDIASLLKPNAVNWLYLNAADYGDLAAFIFNANITIRGGSAAAPNISPNTGGNTGQVSVSIIGSGFEGPSGPGRAGPTLTLSGPGPTITATNVNVVNPYFLTGTFNLTNVATGVWTVTITNADTSLVVLKNAFTVQAGGGANLQIQKIANEAVAGYNETMFITVTNTGAVDSGPTPVEDFLSPDYRYVSSDTATTSVEQEPNPIIADVNPDIYTWSLEWQLPKVAAGSSVNLAYTSTLDQTVPGGTTTNEGVACFQLANDVCKDHFINCMNAINPGHTAEAVQCITTEKTLSGDWVNCEIDIAKCVRVLVSCDAFGGIICEGAVITSKMSKDPNDLVGPSGYGPQEWFIPRSPVQYALSFSNEPTATKAATNVYTTDTFDPVKFQVNTLNIGAIIIGNTVYTPSSIPLASQPFTHDIDLRPTQDLIVRVNAALDAATNQVSVNFLSIDPATGLAPTSGVVGFLPPGGGGSILFTVAPQPGYVTGTTISDEGSVIFDTNAPIFTPVYTNTVDIDPPASKVTALAASEPSTFLVNWSGTDKGSGIATYTIYASDNGGAFTPWQTAVAATSASYPGVAGHTYGFYSIATDGAGNVEAAKTAAEATTLTALTPQVAAISPTYGAPAAFINIAGSHFGTAQGNGSVMVGDTFAEVTGWSDSAITVRVPSRAETGNVTVTSGGTTSNGVPFTFYPFPSITNLSATSGPVGSSVTINGNNLLDGGNKATVSFNGVPAAISGDTASRIQVTVPPGATTGPVRILVNGVLVLSPVNFTVTRIVPQVSAISPNYGAPSAYITITGSNFGATQGEGYVLVGGAIPEVTSWSDASITIRVPSDASTGSLAVRANGALSNAVPFTFYPFPSITGLSANSAPVGASLTITGNNLLDGANNPTVTFNGIPAAISSDANGSIQVIVPAGATSGRILLKVNGVISVAAADFIVTPATP